MVYISRINTRLNTYYLLLSVDGVSDEVAVGIAVVEVAIEDDDVPVEPETVVDDAVAETVDIVLAIIINDKIQKKYNICVVKCI